MIKMSINLTPSFLVNEMASGSNSDTRIKNKKGRQGIESRMPKDMMVSAHADWGSSSASKMLVANHNEGKAMASFSNQVNWEMMLGNKKMLTPNASDKIQI